MSPIFAIIERRRAQTKTASFQLTNLSSADGPPRGILMSSLCNSCGAFIKLCGPPPPPPPCGRPIGPPNAPNGPANAPNAGIGCGGAPGICCACNCCYL